MSDELSIRTIHKVVTFALPSTVETVYTTCSPLGEICGSPTLATRSRSAAIITRRGDCAFAPRANKVRQSAAAIREYFFMTSSLISGRTETNEKRERLLES